MTVPILQAIQEGRRLLQRGDRAGARTLLTQSVRRFPKESELWYWLARSLDDPDHARDALQRALKLDPTFQQARTYLAELDGEGPTSGPPPPELFPFATPPAPPVADPISPGDADLSIVPPAAEPIEPPEASPATPEPNGTQWTFLEELTGAGGAAAQVDAEPAPAAAEAEEADEGTTWAFLEELEGDFSQDGAGGTLPRAASERGGARVVEDPSLDPDAPPVSEGELWRRAEAFLDSSTPAAMPPPQGLAIESVALAPEQEPSLPPIAAVSLAPAPSAPERGSFSFLDAPPSPVATLPVRNSLPPLTAEQILEAANGAAAPKAERAGRQSGPRRRLLPVLLLLAILAVLAATALASGAIGRLPFGTTARATPFPAPAWVQEAQAARYANDFATAESVLREGLASTPDEVVGQVALSQLLRDQVGREGEAVAVAEEALGGVRNLDERALAAEAFVWTMARQAQPDVGRMLASAEQAATETPQSPHAQWARALAAAVEGDSDVARETALLAGRLAPIEEAAQSAAKEAEVLARVGDGEAAVQDYERALETVDYVPWRIALVRLLRELGRAEEAETHLTQLRALAPDDPGVLELDR